MSIVMERETRPEALEGFDFSQVATSAPTGRSGYTVSQLAEIRGRIELLSERRQELWRELSETRDERTRAELRRIDRQIEKLWDEQRRAQATIRFGDRDSILQRARIEYELETAGWGA